MHPWNSVLTISKFVVPQTSQRIGDTEFSVAAPRASNRIPTELLRSTSTFWHKFKSFYFGRHVECVSANYELGGTLEIVSVTVTVCNDIQHFSLLKY